MPEPQDPQDPQDPSTAGRLFSPTEFAGVIRKLYPSLSNATPDDNKLTTAILRTHPEFRSRVTDPEAGMAGRPALPALPDYGTGLRPPSPIPSEDDQTPLARRASAKGGPGTVPTTVGEARAGARRQDESYAGQFLASPVTGATRVVGGVKQIWNGKTWEERAGGAADVIGGGMEAAMPLVPGALFEAPLAVGTGLVLGTGAATGTEKLGTAMNAPPGFVHLASELAGLAAGVAGGEGAEGFKARAIKANDQFRTNLSRPPTGLPDLGGESVADGMMLDSAKRAAEVRSDDQSLQNVLGYKIRQGQDAEIDKLSLGLAENYRLSQLAKTMKTDSAAHGSPFETLDAFSEGNRPPTALPPAPEPAGLLGPGSPARFLADASDQVYPGPGGLSDPNAVDVVNPAETDQRLIATSEAPPPPLVQTLGEQLASGLENQPPEALQPRPTEATRTKLQDRMAFKQRAQDTIAHAVDEMDYMGHSRGKFASDTADPEGGYYTPPIAGSDWYWRVVDRGTNNPPSRAMIGEYMRAFRDGNGTLRGKDLPAAVVAAGQKALDLKTPGGFRRAYEDWAPKIQRAVRNRTTAMLGYERVARERAAAEAATGTAPGTSGPDSTGAESGAPAAVPPEAAPGSAGVSDVEPTSGPAGASGTPPPIDVAAPPAEAAPPPPLEPWTRNQQPKLKVVNPEAPPAAVETAAEAPASEAPHPAAPPEKLPSRALSPGEEQGVQDLGDLFDRLHPNEDESLPGNGEITNQDTLAEDEKYRAEAEALANSEENFGSLSKFFEHMKGEEGVLTLNVGPNSKRGLKDWLERHADEYGGEDWHQRATKALEDGDQQTAWRIAAIASTRSMASAGRRGMEDNKDRTPIPGMTPGDIKDFRDSPRYTRQVDALKKELGVKKLPEGIDLNEEGQMTFGPPEKNLKAAATDLLLGKNFASDVIDMADPRKIIRIEGNKDPELRINRQMAEQLVRSMPDEIVDPLMELLKIPDRAEFAKHFARTVSSWGKGLRMLKDWQDDHWSEIVHIANPRPEGIGMGAAHLDEIRTTGGFADWLKDATPADKEEVGFALPSNIKEGSKEAESFAKSWFRQREARAARRITLAKTIGELAQDGSALDKAMIAGALEPAGGKSRGTLDAVENTSRAFVISQPVTLIRNLWTQAARYSVGVLDDALASGYSMLAMDPKGATKFADRALQTAKAVATPGNVSGKMLKTPWLDSLETTYNYMAETVPGLPAEDMRKTIALMDQFPRRASQYGGGLALENTGGETTRPTSKIPGVNQLIQPEVRNFVTVLGRTQEMAFRGAVFDSSMRAALRAEGLDPAVELAGDPNQLIAKLGEKKMDQMIGGAVASALDYTFAAKPYPGSIPAALLHTFSDIPVFSALLRMGFPFPRFNWVSAPRWIYDHSPAALMDIPLGIMGAFTSENAPFKGRLYRGIEAGKIQEKVLPHLASEIGKTEYTIATELQKFVSSKVEAQQAAKSFKALEARAAKTGMLPELHDEIVAAGQEMQAKITAAAEAKQAHKDATTQLRELKTQQKGAEEKFLKIKEIGAPTTAEYFARQTTGAAMLGAAYLMRSSDGAKDTKWYEYNVEAPGFGKHTLDLRSFAPMVQFLLPADVLHDVHDQTDWKKVADHVKAHPGDWEGAMTANYHGKYTGSTAAAEAATAFLSISPLVGTTAGVVDYMLGRGGTVKQGITSEAASAVLSVIGQFLGRFTTPLRPLKDLAGQFDPEEAKARIPEESSDKSHHLEEVYGPTVANLPYVSQIIPEKKSPLTGQPIATVNPIARAFAGLSEHDKTRIETEIAHTGIEYSKLVPRQTGDREFDNVVAEAYHEGLVKYSGKLLDHPQYQKMAPDLRRDILMSAFGGLKQYALAEAGKRLGLTAAASHDKTESPAAKQKIERWKGYLQELRQEVEKDHPQAPDADAVQEQPPQALNQAGGGGMGEHAPPAALG